MIKLIRLLHHSPVFVSLYEASSTDGTKAAIQPLVQVLETLNVAHRVVHGNEIRNSEQSKANFVATLRNRVMVHFGATKPLASPWALVLALVAVIGLLAALGSASLALCARMWVGLART